MVDYGAKTKGECAACWNSPSRNAQKVEECGNVSGAHCNHRLLLGRDHLLHAILQAPSHFQMSCLRKRYQARKRAHPLQMLKNHHKISIANEMEKERKKSQAKNPSKVPLFHVRYKSKGKITLIMCKSILRRNGDVAVQNCQR